MTPPSLAAVVAAAALALAATAGAATTAPPTLATSFTPNQIDVTGSSSVQYTITDPNASATLYNVSFTDTLPAGVVLDSPVTETDSGCTSSTPSAPVVTYTANPGASTMTVSVPQVKSGTPCTVQFPVTANAVGGGADSFAAGAYTYATSASAAGTAAPSSAEATATLQVIPQPTVTVSGVRAGATYKYGQTVTARYTCAQPGLTAGIATCSASDDLGNSINSGQKLATKQPGRHALTIQAVDALGDVVSDEVDYTVLPNNVFTIAAVKAGAGGSLAFTLALPGAGAMSIKEFAGGKLISAKTARVRGKAKLAETLGRHGTAAKGLSNVKGKLQVTYTPTGGKKNTVTKGGIIL